MQCQGCKEEVIVIYIDEDHNQLCEHCYDVKYGRGTHHHAFGIIDQNILCSHPPEYFWYNQPLISWL